MIDRMTKYSFVLLSGKTEEFLQQLRTLGLVDITRSSKPVDEKSSALLSQSESLAKSISILQNLDLGKDPDLGKIQALSGQRTDFDDPATLARETASRIDSLLKEITAANAQVERLRPWGDFSLEAIEGLLGLGMKVRFYTVPKKKFDPSWAASHALQEVFDNGTRVWFVTVSDDPDYSFPIDETTAPTESLSDAKLRLEALKEELVANKARLLDLKSCVPSIMNEYAAVSSDLQLYLADAGAGKAADDLITTFEGFAPCSDEEALCAEFDKMDVLYFKETAVKDDNPPIRFKENKFVKMFTVLTDMYGRPAYDEFDPTPYISIFFTLFFAMCMGDAGYGLLLIPIALLMRKGKGFIADVAPLVLTLGTATLVMGTVLHTFFGMDTSTAAWVPGWMKKCMITGTVMGYDAQMVFSIGIGVLHLCVAMVLKCIYAIKRQGFLGSLGTSGWTLLIVGGVVVGGFALVGVIDSALTKWIVIALGCVSAVGIFLFNDIHRNPLINVASGLYETYNTVTGLLGDVLSYLRLYALGLAGGMLGNAFNSLSGSVFDVGGAGGIIGGALILILGHVLNLAMAALGAFVHPLRLNFLEFFKNSGYEGTGRTYSPLTAAEKAE